jgi:hypothetical protein
MALEIKLKCSLFCNVVIDCVESIFFFWNVAAPVAMDVSDHKLLLALEDKTVRCLM